MGKTSTAAKQRWNTKHYSQIKVYANPETAAAFKAACVESGSSMSSELGAFMEEFAHPTQDMPIYTKVKTLGDRRKTMRTVINLLTDIRDAEKVYLESTPENLRKSIRYEMARKRLDMLTYAIATNEEIYER